MVCTSVDLETARVVNVQLVRIQNAIRIRADAIKGGSLLMELELKGKRVAQFLSELVVGYWVEESAGSPSLPEQALSEPELSFRFCPTPTPKFTPFGKGIIYLTTPETQ